MKIDTNDILNSILESLSRIDYIKPENVMKKSLPSSIENYILYL